MTKQLTRIIIILTMATCISRIALAQSTEAMGGKVPVIITKINEDVKFDGILDEPFWNTASNFPVTRQTPDYQSAPSEETDLRMVYTNEHVWFGARMYYKDPSNTIPNSVMEEVPWILWHLHLMAITTKLTVLLSPLLRLVCDGMAL
jgi:hypothetical protein